MCLLIPDLDDSAGVSATMCQEVKTADASLASLYLLRSPSACSCST